MRSLFQELEILFLLMLGPAAVSALLLGANMWLSVVLLWSDPPSFSVDRLSDLVGRGREWPSERLACRSDKLKAVGQELGHEIRIFSSTTFELMTSKLPRADQEEDDDFYELQPGDYYKLISNRIAEQSKVLKTRKIREAELAAQRARLTKVGRNMMHYATI
ncbi:Tether containing UBX domain for GLUT4 [Hordeum vulgare]|nr:Tether containing UBX domain for GLUT4 [Hordeum vulgare]